MLYKNQPSQSYYSLIEPLVGAELGQEPYCQVIESDNIKYVIGAQTLTEHNWKIIMAIPYVEVNENAGLIAIEIMLVLLLTVLVFGCTSLLISRGLSRPIRQLAQVMDSYHSNKPIPFIYGENETKDLNMKFEERKDEVGTIYRSYEQMVSRVDHLIKEIYIKDLEKKDAELALMQSQINPHFLYNTLDSINWLAMLNGQDEISEMVTAFSDTFRLSLQKTNSSYVQIRQELEYINSYLSLQKFRFGGKLNYEFAVPEQVKDWYILRFIIQPLVENAIKHGIALLDEGGTILISMYQQDGMLKLHVIHESPGIDVEKMKELLAFDEHADTFLNFNQDSGYGLQNMIRRIKIVHGSEYGIEYHVLQDGRTDCEVSLPIVTTDHDAESKGVDTR
jgi:two-component system sensor histidine kinase YesM